MLGDLLSDLCTGAAGGSPVRLPSRLVSTLSSIGAPGFESGEALTPSTCASGIGSLRARSAAMETALGFESDLLKAMNSTLSQLSAAANAASATASPGVELSVSAASAAAPARIRAAARRHLTVRVRGRGGRQLRHIRIFLNGRKLAERHAARATARIHWHRVGPGAHHVHARVTDDRGERVIRHVWLVRRRQSS